MCTLKTQAENANQVVKKESVDAADGKLITLKKKRNIEASEDFGTMEVTLC